MKIAVATDDGSTVSMHFGRASQYVVLTVEEGEVVGREMRPKFSPHGTAAQAKHGQESGPHGTGPGSDARHDQMTVAIEDCSALICGGMGQGAYDRISAGGIRPVVTDLRGVDEAAIECAAGRIVDHSELLH